MMITKTFHCKNGTLNVHSLSDCDNAGIVALTIRNVTISSGENGTAVFVMEREQALALAAEIQAIVMGEA